MSLDNMTEKILNHFNLPGLFVIKIYMLNVGPKNQILGSENLQADLLLAI